MRILVQIGLIALLAAGARAESFTAGPDELRDPAFWKQVNASLAREPGEVIIHGGTHIAVPSIRIANVGHEQNHLTIRAAAPGEAVFVDDPGNREEKNGLLALHECQNVLVKDLAFTGPQRIAWAMAVFNSKDIAIEGCRFEDLLGAFYSALSVTGSETDRVTVKSCAFRRIGFDAHAHMIYSSYGVRRLSVIDCTFEDCAGDFLRFRDETDFGVVWGCRFKSTGTFKGKNPPMIVVPLFNDDDPAANKPTPNYEYFGTHFIFAHNQFEYAEAGPRDTRFAVLFHHTGFDPPGRRHLLTKDEAATLAGPDAAARKKLLLENAAIDLERIHIFDNTSKNVDKHLVYQCYPAFGAPSRGFSGTIDLSDLINAKPVVQTADEAATYYQKAISTAPVPGL